MPILPSPERNDKDEDGNDHLSPMNRFKALAVRLARVNRTEVEDAERAERSPHKMRFGAVNPDT